MRIILSRSLYSESDRPVSIGLSGSFPGSNSAPTFAFRHPFESCCCLRQSFDHFMMDVIQAWDFSVFEERYGISEVLEGERCQDGVMAVGF